jgi:hypothetical protein
MNGDIYIDVKTNTDAVARQLGGLAAKQFPFALAQGINALATDVQRAEKEALPKVFKNPTPFTVNSIRVIPARKELPVATVFVQDIAAGYLYPYEVHSLHKLIGKGVTYLQPADYSLLNQYGNFPPGTLERLIGTKNYQGTSRTTRGKSAAPGVNGVFLATIMTKKGRIEGAWMRVGATGKRSGKGRNLKLLLKFGDAHVARNPLNFGQRAEQLVKTNFNKRIGQALARAIATAKF